jgi:hypothetical protein
MGEELPRGDTLGDFTIEELVGRGGMGLVYRAVQVGLERKVALKVIAPHLAEDHVFQDRFRREARQAAAIDHPSIIPVYAAGEIAGRLYLAMRYVTGTDLSSLLLAEGRLTPERTMAILGQIAGALDAAHAGGLVHRDVKPANILIEQRTGFRERAYLTDFGLVRHASDTALTQTGSWLGTVNYMPPEQFQAAGAVDGRADQYSLACVAFEMLTGAPPFPRDSDPQAMFAHLNDPPPQLSQARPELPSETDAVLTKALAKLPADRYGSCAEFISTLGAAAGVARQSSVLGDEPLAATAVAPTMIDGPGALDPGPTQEGRLPTRRRRRPDRWVLGGSAAVAIIVAAIVVVLLTRGSSHAPTRPVNAARKPAESVTDQLLDAGLPTTGKGVLALAGTPTDGSALYRVNGGHLGKAMLRLTYDRTLLRIHYYTPKKGFEYALNEPSGDLRWFCTEKTGTATRCYPHDNILHPRPGEIPGNLSLYALVINDNVVAKIANPLLPEEFKALINSAHPPTVTESHQAGVPVACFGGKVGTSVHTLCASRLGIPTYLHLTGPSGGKPPTSDAKDYLVLTATSITNTLGTGAFNPPAKLQ